ncbi:thioredoxin-dependent thiol peroxidase [Candidatus Uhrbacteria bacterium]|nr:thioredoxin-dependent thiol peroxidase [Candidatus Uhrbacteria bacterium]
MKLESRKAAPDFTLPDQQGKPHTLSDSRGQWVLLYFYPKDDTPGCTQEACGIRDHFLRFRRAKLKVLGVSVDSVRSHEKFVKKYDLPFVLLSDTEKMVVKTYGVWAKKKFMGKEYMGINRTSFLIDPDGIIARVYKDVKPAIHAEQVLDDLKGLL